MQRQEEVQPRMAGRGRKLFDEAVSSVLRYECRADGSETPTYQKAQMSDKRIDRLTHKRLEINHVSAVRAATDTRETGQRVVRFWL